MSEAVAYRAVDIAPLCFPDAVTLPLGLRRVDEGLQDNTPTHPPNRGLDPLNEAIARDHAATRLRSARVRCGHVVFQRHWFFGSECLPINPAGKTILYGDGLNWPRHYLETYLAANQATAAGEQAWRLVLPDPSEVNEPAVVLGTAGAYVFGHWIVDLIPALHRFRQTHDLGEHAILLGTLQPWIRHLLMLLDVPLDRVRAVADGELVAAAHALKPDQPKTWYGMMTGVVREGLLDFKDRCRVAQQRRAELVKPAARLFLSRAGWGSRDPRMAAAEEAFVGEGFVVVRPEEHPIERLSHILRHARVIVGEDGSALHNSAIAPRGCLVVVLETRAERNPVHMWLAESLQQYVHYVPADALDRPVEIAARIKMLERS